MNRHHFDEVDYASASALAELMDADATLDGLWRPEELRAILTHHLNDRAPIDRGESGSSSTLGQLLLCEDTPLDALSSLKSHFAASGRGSDWSLPPEVSTFFYFISAAALILRHDTRSGPKDGIAHADGLSWAVCQVWGDERCRLLCEQALARIHAAGRRAAPLNPRRIPTIPSSSPRLVPQSNEGDLPTKKNVAALPFVPGYEVQSLLGEGGMGSVWRAIQLATRREVALKTMGAAWTGSERTKARFEREVQLTARLEHPHIARVYDSGVHQGTCFYAMELVDGRPLDAYVEHARLSQRQVLELMSAVCRAVAYAHQNGVIHRDLKPNNIFVTKDGQPRVLDFGLARAVEESSVALTLDGDFSGTPAYMSPEQATGSGRLDTRSDVYSLAVVLYLLLVGRSPYDLTAPRLDLLNQIRERDVRIPSETRLDRDLVAVLHKALARDREQRYPSATEFANDLERVLKGEPVSARAPTLAYFAANRLRKHWFSTFAAASVAAVLTVVALIGYFKVQHEQQRAVIARNQADAQARLATERAVEVEVRLAAEKVALGNARAAIGYWTQAIADYQEAWDIYDRRRLSARRVESALAHAYEYARVPLSELVGHVGHVNGVAIAPDQRHVFTGADDATVREWDVITGRCLRVFKGHVDAVHAVAVSLDGHRLFSGGHDGTMRLWDIETGRLVRTFDAEGQDVTRIALSPDGRLVVAIVAGRQAGWVWDMETGRRLYSLEKITNIPLNRDVAFSADGRFLAVCGFHWGLVVLNAKTGTPLLDNFSWWWHQGQDPGHITSVAFSPDGKAIVSGSSHQDLALYLLTQDKKLLWRKALHGGPILKVAFSQDGKRIYSTSTDGTIRVWDASDGAPLHCIWADTGDSDVAWSEDGSWAVSGGADGVARIWEMRPDSEVAVLRGNIKKLEAVALSRDGRLAAAGGGGDAVEIWDVARRALLSRVPMVKPVLALNFSSDGDRLLCGGDDGRVDLIDVKAGRRVWFVGKDHDPIKAVKFSDDGRRALSASGMRMLLWDLSFFAADRDTPVAPSMIYTPPTVIVGTAVFSHDGRRVLSASTHGFGTVWDVDTGEIVSTPENEMLNWGHIDSSVGYLPDDHTIFCYAPALRSFGLFDAMTHKCRRRFRGRHLSTVDSVDVSADGRWGASGSRDGTVKLWSIEDGDECVSFSGHTEPIQRVALSADGSILISVAHDGTVRAWDLSRPARYRAFSSRLNNAREKMQQNPNDSESRSTFAEWYVFRHRPEWASQVCQMIGKPVTQLP